MGDGVKFHGISARLQVFASVAQWIADDIWSGSPAVRPTFRSSGVERMARARTDITSIRADIIDAVHRFRPHCQQIDEQAWAQLETYVAITLRVLAKTNPSKVADAARTEEISARLTGRECLED